MLTKTGPSLVYITKNYEPNIVLITLRETPKFYSISRNAFPSIVNSKKHKKKLTKIVIMPFYMQASFPHYYLLATIYP